MNVKALVRGAALLVRQSSIPKANVPPGVATFLVVAIAPSNARCLLEIRLAAAPAPMVGPPLIAIDVRPETPFEVLLSPNVLLAMWIPNRIAFLPLVGMLASA